MRYSTDSKVFLALLIGLLLLVAVGLASIATLQQFEEAALVRARTHEVMASLEALMFDLKDAESSQRGYLLTQDPTYLRPFARQIQSAPESLQKLKSLALDSRVKQKLETLGPLIEEKSAEMQETIDLQDDDVSEAALDIVKSNRGRVLMQEIRKVADDITVLQAELLDERNRRVQYYHMLCIALIFTAILLTIALKGLALWIIRKDMQKRRRDQAALSSANSQLEEQVTELNSRNSQASLLRSMINQLQACESHKEASEAIAQYSGQLFAGSRGAVYAYNASRDMAEAVATWGDGDGTAVPFTPQDCWALRLGHDYRHDEAHRGLRCNHVEKAIQNYLCVPMLAQGDAVGMLHLAYPDGEDGREKGDAFLMLAGAVADQVAGAMVNLKLRETLQQRSIRDPLTGLFNRRFLEENLNRELKAAERRGTQLCLVMIDLDHFKRLNDNYGHEAGDAVLTAVGQLLLSSTRTEDICCRYGGEELAVVLPETDLDNGIRRAQNLCDGIEALLVRHNDSTHRVTASLGVAAFPIHGTSRDALVRAADLALYQAKKQGRNRVVSA